MIATSISTIEAILIVVLLVVAPVAVIVAGNWGIYPEDWEWMRKRRRRARRYADE